MPKAESARLIDRKATRFIPMGPFNEITEKLTMKWVDVMSETYNSFCSGAAEWDKFRSSDKRAEAAPPKNPSMES